MTLGGLRYTSQVRQKLAAKIICNFYDGRSSEDKLCSATEIHLAVDEQVP